MLETLFWVLVGAFIGWNFPQPQFAKNFQAKYLQKYIDNVKKFEAANGVIQDSDVAEIPFNFTGPVGQA